MRLICLALILIQTDAVIANEIRLRSYSHVSDKKQLILADIAEIKISNKLQEKQVKAIALSDVPVVGEKRTFTAKGISSLLRDHLQRIFSEDERPKLVIPNEVVVEHINSFSEEMVQRELIRQWKRLCESCEFKIEAMQLPQLPDDIRGGEWTISESYQLSRGGFTQKVLFKNATLSRVYWINGHVKIEHKVPVANRILQYGEPIKKEDVDWLKRDITFSYDRVPKHDSIIEQKVGRVMRPGQIVWQSAILREKAVYRGDLVKVINENAQFQISLTGVAQADAFIGDVINIVNPKSKKLMSGTVFEKGKVIVQ